MIDESASNDSPPSASSRTSVGRPFGDVSRPSATLAGAVAAGVALAAGELVCGLAGSGPSLVTAVGTQFIDRFAASLKDLAIAVFGTNDKPALVVGIVVVSIALGAVLGRAAVRMFPLAVAGFGAFGLVGLLSYLGDPQGTTSTGIVATIVSVVAGVATLVGLLAVAGRVRAPRQTSVANDPDGAATPAPAGAVAGGARRATVARSGAGNARRPTRRSFIVSAGAVAAGAAGAAVLGRHLGRTEVVDAARRSTVLPQVDAAATVPSVAPSTAPPVVDSGVPTTSSVAPAPTSPFAVDGLSPYITPNHAFYRIDTALSTPQVDVGSWQLDVTGMVDRPFSIGFDELVDMSRTEDVVTLSCVSNEVGGNLVGNARWQGVPLATLLERAGVQSGATQIVGRSVDDFTAGFPTEIALDGRTALVAVGMNGEPLPADHGFPARLVVAGLYGYVSATKWLRQIELTTWEDFDGYWVPRGWSKEGPIKTMSRIDVPRSGAAVIPGPQAIAGVAWAPPQGIERVEVRVDDGEWRAAQLGDATSGNTWVQWYLEWDATSGEHQVQVRATGVDGVTQTEDAAAPAPNGASGWHRRTVQVS